MTFQQGLSFAVLAGTMALFIWGRWRYDVVAVTGLLAGLLVGVISPEQAFTGFSNEAGIFCAFFRKKRFAERHLNAHRALHLEPQMP